MLMSKKLVYILLDFMHYLIYEMIHALHVHIYMYVFTHTRRGEYHFI